MSAGGKRKNSGRKKGSLSKKTIEQKVVEDAMRTRILRSAESLLNAQMQIAQGTQMLYCVKTYKNGKRSKPFVITDQKTIEAYLAGELGDEKNEYYFIATHKPDNKALDSLFDRVFGKATTPIDLDPKERGGFTFIIKKYNAKGNVGANKKAK